jgi:hypothetical protein
MNSREEPTARPLPPSKPNRELLLAQALDACIRVERSQPGCSSGIIARQPASVRAELRQLVALARSISASAADLGPSADFVEGARSRLMGRITGEPVALSTPVLRPADGGSRRRHRRRSKWKWLVRGSVGLLAAVIGTTATLSASASSLPGDLLYSVKQAQEELNLRLAADDQARVLALLRRADARLDETARLLEQGRTYEAVQVAQRYDQSVERATTAFVVTVDHADEASRYEHLEITLGMQQERLATILQSAPEPARPDLREALALTERGRELMADPRPVERVLGLRQRRPPAAAAAAVPTSQTEEQPTSVSANKPGDVKAALAPAATATPAAMLARADRDESEADRSGHQADSPIVAKPQTGNSNSGVGGARQQASVSPASADARGGEGEHNADESHSQAAQPARVAVEPTSVEHQAHISGAEDNHAGDEREDQPLVARPASESVGVSAGESRASSGRTESSTASGGGTSGPSRSGGSNTVGGAGGSVSGAAIASAAPPQPAPISGHDGSDERTGSTAASSSSVRTAPTPTATVRRSGDTSKSGAGSVDSSRLGSSGSGDRDGDSKSGSGGDR